jgi:predicted permease
VTLALLIKGIGVQLPLPISRTIEIAANGAIPVMLILLGLELTRIQWSHNFRALGWVCRETLIALLGFARELVWL